MSETQSESFDLFAERDVRRFFEIYHDRAAHAFRGVERPGVINLCRLYHGDETGLRHERFGIGDVDGMTAAAVAHARSGHNVWTEVRTVRPGLPGGSRGGKADTVGVFALVIDADADKGKGGTVPLAPTMTVESSPGNFHHWYFFDRALLAGEADELGARLRAAAAADADTGNIAQPYRVAGTPNLLTPKKRARGRTEPTPTRIVAADGPVYTADELRAALPELPLRGSPAASEGAPREIADLLSAVPESLRHEIAEPATDDMNRSAHFFGVSGKLKARGMQFDEVLSLWEHFPDSAASKYASRRGGIRHQLEKDWGKLLTREEAAAQGYVDPDPALIEAMQSRAASDAFADHFGLERPNLPPSPETALGAQRAGPQPATQPTSLTALETVRASDFAGLPTPTRDFLFVGLMQIGQVTMLSGPGAVGKSLLALQAAVSVVSGTGWLGRMPMKSGPVLYVSAEDDLSELHIRLKTICEEDQIDLAALHGLELADLTGKPAALAEETKLSVLRLTTLFNRLRVAMERSQPVMLVLDNLADVFAGNENVKSLARQFIGHLRGLAIEFECAVLLLSHPSQSGISSGSGESGNVGWRNSVRYHLYMTKPAKDDPHDEVDPLIRQLEAKKVNYGDGEVIEMRWERGRFAPTAKGLAPKLQPGVNQAAMDAKAEAVFLSLLAKVNDQGLRVFPSTGRGYAPSYFADHPDANGVKKRQFERAMHRLLERGQIKIVETGKPSARVRMLVVVPAEEVEM